MNELEWGVPFEMVTEFSSRKPTPLGVGMNGMLFKFTNERSFRAIKIYINGKGW